MKNCFFEDLDYDFIIKVHLKTFIEKDNHGYYIDIFINKQDVLKLITIGVRPYWSESRQHYYIKVNLSNNTRIFINGLRLDSFENKYISKIRTTDVVLKEISLSKYKNEHNKRQCYANKIIFMIPNKRKIF